MDSSDPLCMEVNSAADAGISLGVILPAQVEQLSVSDQSLAGSVSEPDAVPAAAAAAVPRAMPVASRAAATAGSGDHEVVSPSLLASLTASRVPQLHRMCQVYEHRLQLAASQIQELLACKKQLERRIELLVDELQTTRRNYESQIAVLSDHYVEQQKYSHGFQSSSTSTAAGGASTGSGTDISGRDKDVSSNSSGGLQVPSSSLPSGKGRAGKS